MNPDPRSERRSTSILAGVCLARVPWRGLAALAGLRRRGDVRVEAEGEAGEGGAWVAWEPQWDGRDEVVEALLPVEGVVFYRREGGRWFRAGRRLPEFGGGPPAEIGGGGGRPLHRVIVPGPIRGDEPGPARGAGGGAVVLRVVRDERERTATAAVVTAVALARWAEWAPTARLRGLRAARSGDRVLVVGRRLPPIGGLGRSWGGRVRVPLGFRPEPDLPEARLAEAIGLPDDGSIALVGEDGAVEVVPGRALATLSRGAARRMAGLAPRPPRGPTGGSGG